MIEFEDACVRVLKFVGDDLELQPGPAAAVLAMILGLLAAHGLEPDEWEMMQDMMRHNYERQRKKRAS